MPDKTDISQLGQDKTLEVAKCDLKPVSNEPLIRVIRGQQVMLDADLASFWRICNLPAVTMRICNSKNKR